MVEKVIFDADSRLIIVDNGVTSLDAEIDLYSAAKREWKDDPTLNKLKPPFRTVAGDPLGGTRVVGAYFFLQNQVGADWRIRPSEADHELVIVGNLYPEDSTQPMIVPTLGEYTVTVHIEKSSLTQKIISGSGVTQQDKEEIAEEVWTHTDGLKLSDLHDLELGRWKVDTATKQMILYKADGQTPLVVFDLKDATGKPSSQDVYERIPVQ